MNTNKDIALQQNLQNLQTRKCTKHPLTKLDKVCTSPNCIKSSSTCLLCRQCFDSHMLTHDTNMKYLDYNEVFSYLLIREIDNVQEDSWGTLQLHQEKMLKRLEELCTTILKEVTQALEITKTKAKQLLKNQISQENLKTLKASVDQQYQFFFSKDPNTLNDQDLQNYIAAYTRNKSQLDKEIVKFEAVIKDTTKRQTDLDNVYKAKLENIKKILENSELNLNMSETIIWGGTMGLGGLRGTGVPESREENPFETYPMFQQIGDDERVDYRSGETGSYRGGGRGGYRTRGGSRGGGGGSRGGGRGSRGRPRGG